MQRRGQAEAKREKVLASFFFFFCLPRVLIKHAGKNENPSHREEKSYSLRAKKEAIFMSALVATCVCLVCVCGWEKPVASLLATPTANELGCRPRALGPERALSPATQLSLADLQLSDYVTVAEKGPAFIHH